MRVLSANVPTDSKGNGWVDIPLGGGKPTGAAPSVLVAQPGKPTTFDRYDHAAAALTIGASGDQQRVQVVGGSPNAVYGVELQVSP